MVGRIVLGVLALLVVALVIVTYAGSMTPSSPQASGPARPINASRYFMLLPDGRVEITDAWARRTYRWDGRRWIELEVTKAPTPVSFEPR
jgi:hypothetical protein